MCAHHPRHSDAAFPFIAPPSPDRSVGDASTLVFPPATAPTIPASHSAAKTKEQETQRVDKELANVRKAFTSGKMSPYDRKKYVRRDCRLFWRRARGVTAISVASGAQKPSPAATAVRSRIRASRLFCAECTLTILPHTPPLQVWKLVYINMLGYDVDFGHMEMIALVSAGTYAEKLVGYLAVSVMLRNTDEQITLVVQAIKNDLMSTQDPIQSLALCAIANIGGKELAETVSPDVQRILFSRSIFPIVRKKAALCLLRLTRISRDLLPPEEHARKLVTLLEDKNLGVVLSVVTLLLGLAERDPAAYEGATGHLLVWLTRLAVQRQVSARLLVEGAYVCVCVCVCVSIQLPRPRRHTLAAQCSEDYIYHGTACPFLQVSGCRAWGPPPTGATSPPTRRVLPPVSRPTRPNPYAHIRRSASCACCSTSRCRQRRRCACA